MTWELCNGSSEYLVDLYGGCDEKMPVSMAIKHFCDKGYYGYYLLIGRYNNYQSFKVYHICIEKEGKHVT